MEDITFSMKIKFEDYKRGCKKVCVNPRQSD